MSATKNKFIATYEDCGMPYCSEPEATPEMAYSALELLVDIGDKDSVRIYEVIGVLEVSQTPVFVKGTL